MMDVSNMLFVFIGVMILDVIGLDDVDYKFCKHELAWYKNEARVLKYVIGSCVALGLLLMGGNYIFSRWSNQSQKKHHSNMEEIAAESLDYEEKTYESSHGKTNKIPEGDEKSTFNDGDKVQKHS